MKVTKTNATDSETSSVIDLFSELGRIDRETKKEIQEQVGEFLVEQILLAVSDAQSPIQGEKWSPLSKDYKKEKEAEGGVGQANMENSGDLLNSFTFEATPEGLKIGFFDDQAPKADGHNKFSGKEGTAPKRRFLPGEGQKFKGNIQDEVDRIVADVLASNTDFDKAMFEDVNSTSGLYAVLKSVLPDLTRSEITETAMRSQRLRKILSDLDLIDLL